MSENLAWHLEESITDGLRLVLDPRYPLFNEALDDSVLPIAGVGGSGMSTYWIDQLVDRLENWSDEPGVEQQLAEGNTTQLLRVDDAVVARSLYEDLPDETLPTASLLPALHAWRGELLVRGADRELPAHLRRPPISLPAPSRGTREGHE